jgi:hypothetical protein
MPGSAGTQARSQLRQLKFAVGDQRVDALLISIGGNDVLFSSTLEALAKFGDAGEQEGLIRAELAPMRGRLRAVRDTLAATRLDVGRVFLVEYRVAFFDKRDGGDPNPLPGPLAIISGDVTGGCGIFDTSTSVFGPRVTFEDAAMVKRMARQLNDTLRVMAQELGWTYVSGVARGFERHGYCSGQSYFVGAETSCREQGDFNGTMHPNEQGQIVYRNATAAALSEHFYPGRQFIPLVPRPSRISAP